MSEAMHIVLKYNDSIYNVDTIEKHREILNNEGKVIWGVIRSSVNGQRISPTRIETIRSQIEDGKTVYAYLSQTGITGGIKARANIIDILASNKVYENIYLVPEYYHKDLDKCVAGILLDNIEYIDSNIINSLKQYGSERGSVALGNQTNPLYVSHINNYKNEEIQKDIEVFIEKSNIDGLDIQSVLMKIYKYINSKGFIFSYEDICNFYLSLKTKPFLILAGISGTGKSKLIQLFSDAVEATSLNGRFRIISVKPDWNDSTELFGYKNINDNFVPGALTSIIAEASRSENINKPYFICLDEMNLARVEYYLSEYLSIIESRRFTNNSLITDRIFPKNYLPESNTYSKIIIPENIYIIGTVNMDDTTFAFSRKVLDRANTIEFSEVRLEELEFVDDKINTIKVDNYIFKTRFLSIKDAIKLKKDYVLKTNSKIIEINNILQSSNSHFGYRVRDEIVFYMLENKLSNLLNEDMAFDYQILQKILPTISGSDYYIKKVLIQLYNFCNPEGKISEEINYIDQGTKNLDTAIYMNSAKKILFMLRGYENGFASFW